MKEENGSSMPGVSKGLRIGFGIFMVIFYVAIGVLFMLDIFKINKPGICLALGIVLVIYGIWRGIRLYKGWR